jgi:hypothetical protein
VKIDLLILQLAVLFLPGIIWARLDANYAAKAKLSDVEFFLRAFLFGITIYAVEFIAFTLAGWPFRMVNVVDVATKEIFTRDIAGQILWGIGIGIVLSILWIYASTYKLITIFLQLIKATKKYGDEDVWDFTFNSGKPQVEYIHFRDFANSYVYSGWVNTFSETDKLRELVLRDVIVSDFDGSELFKLPFLYLARAPENIHIEFPYLEPDAKENIHE